MGHDLPKTYFHELPKVDLHRHLEGSLRLRTIAELARRHNLGLPEAQRLRSLVEIGEEGPFTFENFLSKFQTLRLVYRSPEIISRITQEAVADAAADNIRHLELRFTPVALSRAEGFALADVMDWVIEAVDEARQVYNIDVGLIASVNRHESPALAEQVVGLAVDRRAEGVVGVDLSGNEAQFSAEPFQAIFQDARKDGLHITVHAGEWGGAKNVHQAIAVLGAERIGHGIRVLEDAGTVELARERGVVFETCITSNVQSGAVPSLADHPLRKMQAAGLKVTLNTDDPSISHINLSDEYQVGCQQLGLALEDLHHMIAQAACAAFLPPISRQRLLLDLENEIAGLGL
jgi:adenosine deaminase